MASIFVNRNTDYDGESTPSVANGPIRVVLSGEGSAVVSLHVRAEAAHSYDLWVSKSGRAKFRANLEVGDSYFLKVHDVQSGDSLDLSVTDVV